MTGMSMSGRLKFSIWSLIKIICYDIIDTHLSQYECRKIVVLKNLTDIEMMGISQHLRIVQLVVC